jgi:hypothetical protein
MRCGTAREWLTTAIDGELSARDRLALDTHLAGCPECAAERQRTARLLGALSALVADPSLPPQLEQNTLRRVRQLAADEAERAAEPSRWDLRRWLGVGVPSVAAAAVLVLALRTVAPPRSPAPTPQPIAKAAPDVAPPAPVAAPPVRTARRERPAPEPRVREAAPAETAEAPPAEAPDHAPAAVATREPTPNEPPPELIARPDLFRDLSILQNMEKLQNYDAIETTTLDAGHRGPNG